MVLDGKGVKSLPRPLPREGLGKDEDRPGKTRTSCVEIGTWPGLTGNQRVKRGSSLGFPEDSVLAHEGDVGFGLAILDVEEVADGLDEGAVGHCGLALEDLGGDRAEFDDFALGA